MLLRFVNETIEELASGLLHQRGCAELDPQAATLVHPAGSMAQHGDAPHECWACEPLVIPVLDPTRYAVARPRFSLRPATSER